MFELKTPISEADARKLKAGDPVLITGQMITARDRAHAFLCEKKQELPFSLDGAAIYHMGPIVRQENGKWAIISAGPTTSIREEPYEAKVIRGYGAKAIIGKGGMGAETRKALEECGAVYLSAVGGTAASLAGCIREVVGVHKLDEFGSPEAFWVLKVEKFPAIVTMDSHGNDLHEDVRKASLGRLKRML
ncbi:MAG: FumA C-terminus/TtdB family hydratase beta subunit [Candidatus Bilamarchaeaceae archaeon]